MNKYNPFEQQLLKKPKISKKDVSWLENMEMKMERSSRFENTRIIESEQPRLKALYIPYKGGSISRILKQHFGRDELPFALEKDRNMAYLYARFGNLGPKFKKFDLSKEKITLKKISNELENMKWSEINEY